MQPDFWQSSNYNGTVSAQVVYGGEDYSILVTGGYDRAVKVWDCRSRSFDPVQVMQDAADSVTHVSVGPNAAILAARVDGCVRRYDVRAGRLYTDTLFAPVTCAVLSHDAAMYAAACMDGTIRLLDRVEGDLLQSYKGKCAERGLVSVFLLGVGDLHSRGVPADWDSIPLAS